MNLSLNKLVLIGFVLAAFVFAIIIFKNKATTSEIAQTQPELAVIESTQSNSSNDFVKEAEARREKALAEKEEADLLAKRKLEKENTVECKFWKQQKNEKSGSKVDEKITEFCTL